MKKSTLNAVCQFRDDRSWAQFHNPKDLALSISLEAAELLEHFQWKTPERAWAEDAQGIIDELADVLTYCILMADRLGVDLDAIVLEKLEKNGQKYPVEKSRGKSDKYNRL